MTMNVHPPKHSTTREQSPRAPGHHPRCAFCLMHALYLLEFYKNNDKNIIKKEKMTSRSGIYLTGFFL